MKLLRQISAFFMLLVCSFCGDLWRISAYPKGHILCVIRLMCLSHNLHTTHQIWTGTLLKYLESWSTFTEVQRKSVWNYTIPLSPDTPNDCFSAALGDERRSFSYYKAIPIIEKLPFRIESVDQVKNLPTIGKSLQDHVSKFFQLPSKFVQYPFALWVWRQSCISFPRWYSILLLVLQEQVHLTYFPILIL